MVTGSADDGSWDGCQLGIHGRAKQVSSDLRKTALGASSPAKPALHIPELAFSQLLISKSLFLAASAQLGGGRATLLV